MLADPVRTTLEIVGLYITKYERAVQGLDYQAAKAAACVLREQAVILQVWANTQLYLEKIEALP